MLPWNPLILSNFRNGDVTADSVAISAQGDVAGDINATNAITVSAVGNIESNMSGVDVVVEAQGNIAGKLNANVVSISAGGNVAVNLDADNSTVEAVGEANLSGSSSSVTVNASGGSFSGDFKLISNVGEAVVVVNGRPEVNDKLANYPDTESRVNRVRLRILREGRPIPDCRRR